MQTARAVKIEPKSSKLGLDDFSDEKETVQLSSSDRTVKPNGPSRPSAKPNQPRPTTSSKPAVSSQKQTSARHVTVGLKSASIVGNAASRPISFAAVAAGSVKTKQSASMPASALARHQVFKWTTASSGRNDTREVLEEKQQQAETEISEQSAGSLTLASYLPVSSLTRPAKEASSVSPVIKSQEVFGGEDKGGDVAATEDSSVYQPMKAYTSLFESGDKESDKSPDYFR